MASPDTRAVHVDVIVPIHGAGEALGRCAASLLRHTDLGSHRLVMVLDGPQDASTVAVVTELSGNRGVVVAGNESRLGFAAAVNRGLEISRRDVVLLNSDTLVSARWIDKLAAAAYSDPRIATVTPFSNHATICSLPRFLEENTVPAGHDVESFAALVEGCSQREYPELPTGVGVCLFVKRSVLDEIGGLDQARFGLGYGEETELCLRATRAGYRHVLDDATYIFHEGQRSFGVSRRPRVRAAHRVVQRSYPGYLGKIADFMRQDPLSGARQRVLAALSPPAAHVASSPVERIAHLVHGWPPWAVGGTELYAQWLARRQVASREVAVYARIADPDRLLGEAVEHLDRGIRVRLAVNNFTQRNPLSRNALHSSTLARDFARFLDQVRPDLVHVHHLAGHCASLLEVARRRKVPLVVQLQDWWPLCARANLYHREGYLCSGPSPARCADCLPMTRLPGATAWNPILYALRSTWMKSLLGKADAIVVGSRFIERSYRESGYLPPDVPIHVVPYGIEIETCVGSTDRGRERRLPLRCGYIGVLLPHKGPDVAIEAFAGIAPTDATLEVWGATGDPRYAGRLQELAAKAPGVTLRGGFEDGERWRILSRLDLLIVPSVGLESFGIVAHEAMAAGVPILASERGALSEIFDPSTQGGCFVAGDPVSLREWLLRLVAQPALVARWSQALPAVKGMSRHVEEIDGIYARLLSGDGR